MRGSLLLLAKQTIGRKPPKWAPLHGKLKPSRNRRELLVHRGRGPNPNPVPGKKPSKDMTGRSESCVESVRNPQRAEHPYLTWKIVRGDYVQVIKKGPDNGKRGFVMEVLRKSNSVVVSNVGFTKGTIYTRAGLPQEVVTEGPIDVSDVMIVCPKTDRPTKIEFRYIDGVTKVRVAKTSGAVIPRPAILTERRKPREYGEKDTDPAAVLGMSYTEPEMVTRARFWLKEQLYRHQKRVFDAAARKWDSDMLSSTFGDLCEARAARKDFKTAERREEERKLQHQEQKRLEYYTEEQKALDADEKKTELLSAAAADAEHGAVPIDAAVDIKINDGAASSRIPPPP
mmetsp:Transcript_90/g.255  ORF Transcript_90/g.255 Transcript_90/m.255 type:complete len:342 (+) Transcript_90:97-1122(+)